MYGSCRGCRPRSPCLSPRSSQAVTPQRPGPWRHWVPWVQGRRRARPSSGASSGARRSSGPCMPWR
ncbi:hypothetical protein CyaNS01_00332 [Cyanobium sp. NS01]|nr:hypothetical protein CyaNS01_00332 [Cyanobium sp. NS01]